MIEVIFDLIPHLYFSSLGIRLPWRLWVTSSCTWPTTVSTRKTLNIRLTAMTRPARDTNGNRKRKEEKVYVWIKGVEGGEVVIWRSESREWRRKRKVGGIMGEWKEVMCVFYMWEGRVKVTAWLNVARPTLGTRRDWKLEGERKELMNW